VLFNVALTGYVLFFAISVFITACAIPWSQQQMLGCILSSVSACDVIAKVCGLFDYTGMLYVVCVVSY
jgi:hypothetical protein